MAQINDDRRVAGWTVDKFKNGALSALLPFEWHCCKQWSMAALKKMR
jgi:hypothetical protein